MMRGMHPAPPVSSTTSATSATVYRAGDKRQFSLPETFGPSPWLVMGPHDDDLALGMGLTLAGAIAEGIEIHPLIATDGSIGWCKRAQRETIVALRAQELLRSLTCLGIPHEHLIRLELGDATLLHERGQRPEATTDGLGRRLTAAMRRIRPGAVFVCSPTDHNPDHQALAAELPMVVGWATSAIWDDLGAPIARPRCWHYPVYAPLPIAPTLAVVGKAQGLAAKQAAIAVFQSQRQIGELVAAIGKAGAREYFSPADLPAFDPAAYQKLFPVTSTPSEIA